ncbi:MAG: phosphatidate cytidylyltransferase [bacterium]
MAFKDLGKRLLVAGVGGPLIIAAAWFGKIYFFLLVAAIAIISANEFIHLLKQKKSYPPLILTLPAVFSLCVIVYFNRFGLIIPLIASLVFFALLTEIFRPANNAVLNVSGVLTTFLYIGGLMSFMIALRELPTYLQLDYMAGGEWLVTILLAIWICDSAAYFVGSRFGKHKLAAKISPNKTIEGAIGGIVAGLLTTWICQMAFAKSLSLQDALVIGLITGVFGQMSDLVESMFKRDAGVKDTSSLLPGHGGVLDRFDSEMLVVPAVYFYLLAKFTLS